MTSVLDEFPSYKTQIQQWLDDGEDEDLIRDVASAWRLEDLQAEGKLSQQQAEALKALDAQEDGPIGGHRDLLNSVLGQDTSVMGKMKAKHNPSKEVNPDAGLWDTFKGGVDRGLQQTQASLYGALGLVGDLVGDESLTKAGIDGYQRNMAEAGEAGGRQVNFREIDGVGDFLHWATGAVGEFAPTLATTLGTGGTGGVMALLGKGVVQGTVKKAVGKKILKEMSKRKIFNKGFGAGTFVASATQAGGQTFGKIEQETGETAGGTALVSGLAQGAIESLPLLGMLGRFGGPEAKKGLFGSIVGALDSPKVLGRMGKGAVAEGFTEGIQETIEEATVKYVDENYEMFGGDWGQLIDVMAVGSLLGGSMGALPSGKGPGDDAKDLRATITLGDKIWNVDITKLNETGEVDFVSYLDENGNEVQPTPEEKVEAETAMEMATEVKKDDITQKMMELHSAQDGETEMLKRQATGDPEANERRETFLQQRAETEAQEQQLQQEEGRAKALERSQRNQTDGRDKPKSKTQQAFEATFGFTSGSEIANTKVHLKNHRALDAELKKRMQTREGQKEILQLAQERGYKPNNDQDAREFLLEQNRDEVYMKAHPPQQSKPDTDIDDDDQGGAQLDETTEPDDVGGPPALEPPVDPNAEVELTESEKQAQAIAQQKQKANEDQRNMRSDSVATIMAQTDFSNGMSPAEVVDKANALGEERSQRFKEVYLSAYMASQATQERSSAKTEGDGATQENQLSDTLNKALNREEPAEANPEPEQESVRASKAKPEFKPENVVYDRLDALTLDQLKILAGHVAKERGQTNVEYPKNAKDPIRNWIRTQWRVMGKELMSGPGGKQASMKQRAQDEGIEISLSNEAKGEMIGDHGNKNVIVRQIRKGREQLTKEFSDPKDKEKVMTGELTWRDLPEDNPVRAERQKIAEPVEESGAVEETTAKNYSYIDRNDKGKIKWFAEPQKSPELIPYDWASHKERGAKIEMAYRDKILKNFDKEFEKRIDKGEDYNRVMQEREDRLRQMESGQYEQDASQVRDEFTGETQTERELREEDEAIMDMPFSKSERKFSKQRVAGTPETKDIPPDILNALKQLRAEMGEFAGAGKAKVMLFTQAPDEDGNINNGWFDPNTGQIGINTEALKGEKTLRSILLHEDLVHRWLQWADPVRYDALIARAKEGHRFFQGRVMDHLKDLNENDADVKGTYFDKDGNMTDAGAEEAIAYKFEFEPNQMDPGKFGGMFLALERKLRKNVKWLNESDMDVQNLMRSAFTDYKWDRVNKKAQEQAKAKTQEVEEEVDEDGTVAYSKGVTKTPAFKRWFGESKSVDQDGNPIVFYHGTEDEITTFTKRNIYEGLDKKTKQYMRSQGMKSPVGFYFTPNASYATMYATKGSMRPKEGSNLMPVYLKMENPKFVESKETSYISPEQHKALKDEGFDSIVVIHPKHGKDMTKAEEVIIFESTSIKSATGNRGGFDPKNPDIRFSKGKGSLPTSKEFNVLQDKLDRAYRSGNQKLIEKYETEFDEMVSTFEDYEADVDSDDQNDFGGEGLDRELALSYNRISKLDYMSEDDIVENLRETYEKHIGFKKAQGLSKKEILDDVRSLVKKKGRRYSKSRPKLDELPETMREVSAMTSLKALKRMEGYDSAKKNLDFDAGAKIANALGKKMDWVAVRKAKADIILPVYTTEGESPNTLPYALGVKLSELSKVPVVDGGLQKVSGVSNTNAKLNDRMRDMKVYKVDPSQIKGKKVAIVDDNYTSGSTVLAVAKAVQDAGGEPVIVVTGAFSMGGKGIKPTVEQVENLLKLTKTYDRESFESKYGFQPTQLTGAEIYRLTNLTKNSKDQEATINRKIFGLEDLLGDGEGGTRKAKSQVKHSKGRGYPRWADIPEKRRSKFYAPEEIHDRIIDVVEAGDQPRKRLAQASYVDGEFIYSPAMLDRRFHISTVIARLFHDWSHIKGQMPAEVRHNIDGAGPMPSDKQIVATYKAFEEAISDFVSSIPWVQAEDASGANMDPLAEIRDVLPQGKRGEEAGKALMRARNITRTLLPQRDLDLGDTSVERNFRNLAELAEQEFQQESPEIDEVKDRGDDNQIRFSKSKVGDKNLAVLHNLKPEAIFNAHKIGGLPVPSLAITRPDKGDFDGYGGISLVADPNLIDPTDRKNKVFDADIYSPRYPTVHNDINWDGLREFNKDLPEGIKELDYSRLEDSRLRDLEFNEAVKYRFLESKGIKPRRIRKDYGLTWDLDRYIKTKTAKNEFKKFVRETFDKVVAKEEIFQGYNNMGNRKYKPHTLENVVRIMTKTLQGGEGMNYGAGSIKAQKARRFRTIEQIKKARDEITTVEEQRAEKEALQTELFDILDDMRRQYKYDQNSWGYNDDASEAIAEYAGGKWSALTEVYDDITQEQKDRINDYVNRLGTSATAYFEAKVQRGVGLNEFRVAIVPKGTDPEVVNILEGYGLRVRKYDPKKTKRSDVITKKERSLLFSKGKKVDGTVKVLRDDGIGQSVATDRPFKGTFLRNTTPAPFFGATYGQDIEPAGKYVTLIKHSQKFVPQGFESGTVDFRKPIVLEHRGYGEDGWKQRLSDAYDGKTGLELSKALREDGYDAIITVDDYGVNETVDLRNLKDNPPRYSKGRITDFASGSDAPQHWKAVRQSKKLEPGFTMIGMNKNTMGRMVDTLKEDGKVFLDSGAFTLFERGAGLKEKAELIDTAMKAYGELANKAPKEKLKNLSVVAPDVIADPENTERVRAQYRDETLDLMKKGVNVIVPVQADLSQSSMSIITDAIQSIRDANALYGTTRYTIGFPSNKASFEAHEIINVVREAKPNSIHLLGAGGNNPKATEVISRIPENIKVSLDSNKRRALVGKDPLKPISENERDTGWEIEDLKQGDIGMILHSEMNNIVQSPYPDSESNPDKIMEEALRLDELIHGIKNDFGVYSNGMFGLEMGYFDKKTIGELKDAYEFGIFGELDTYLPEWKEEFKRNGVEPGTLKDYIKGVIDRRISKNAMLLDENQMQNYKLPRQMFIEEVMEMTPDEDGQSIEDFFSAKRYSKTRKIKAKAPVDPLTENPTFYLDNPPEVVEPVYTKYMDDKERFVDELAWELTDQPFATIPDEDGRYYTVTKSVRKGQGGWQVTRFDEFGPSGHDAFNTYEQAIEDLVDSKVDLSSVQVSDNHKEMPVKKGKRYSKGIEVETPSGFKAEVEPVYIRFGEALEGKASRNHLKGGEEKGVSVYTAWKDPKNGNYLIFSDQAEETDGGEFIGTREYLGDTDREIFIMEGTPLKDIGEDTEVLLDPKDAKTIGKLERGKVSFEEDPSFALDGSTFSDKNTPSLANIPDSELLIPEGVTPATGEVVPYFDNYRIVVNGEEFGTTYGSYPTAQKQLEYKIADKNRFMSFKAKRGLLHSKGKVDDSWIDDSTVNMKPIPIPKENTDLFMEYIQKEEIQGMPWSPSDQRWSDGEMEIIPDTRGFIYQRWDEDAEDYVDEVIFPTLAEAEEHATGIKPEKPVEEGMATFGPEDGLVGSLDDFFGIAPDPKPVPKKEAKKEPEGQKRAKPGGEVGPNGEFYKGGAFIATTEKGKGKPQKKGTGKQEVGAYDWQVPPEEGLRSIYGHLSAGMFDPKYKDGKFVGYDPDKLNMGYMNYTYKEKAPEEAKRLKALARAWNDGKRWMREDGTIWDPQQKAKPQKDPGDDMMDFFGKEGQYEESVETFLGEQDGNTKQFDNTRSQPKEAESMNLMDIMGTDDIKPPKFSKSQRDLLSPELQGKIGVDRKTALKRRGVPLGERTKIWMSEAWDKFVQGYVDNMAPLKGLGERVYRLNRMARGWTGGLQQFLDHGAISWEKDVAVVKDRNRGFVSMLKELGPEDAEKYLLYRMGKRAQDLKAQGKERLFTDNNIKELLALGKGLPTAKLDKQFNELNDSVLQFAVEAGTLDQDKVDLFREEFYIPFHRVMDDKGAEEGFFNVGALRGGKSITDWVKQLHGGEIAVKDPLENVVKNWSTLIEQAIANKARQEAIEIMRQDGSAEDVTTEFSGSVVDKKKERVLSHFENGERKHYRIHDEALLVALTNTKPQLLDSVIWKAFKWPKKTLTYSATFGPAFKIANVIRDSMSVALTHKDYRLFQDTFRGFMGAVTKDDDYIKMMASGGGFAQGYVDEGEAGNIAKKIRREVNPRSVINPLKWVQVWDDFGSALENATRTGLWKRQVDLGVHGLDASFNARDVLDFSMSGASDSVRILTSMTPFMNARIQGLNKLGRSAKENPAHLLKGLAVIGGATALLMSLRDEEEYKKLEDWDRWTYWHFWVGKQHYRIPKPFELSVVPNAVETMWTVTTGDDEKKKVAEFAGYTLFNTFNMGIPFKDSALLGPMLEQYSNKSSFTGRPIVPMHLERLKAGEQAKPWTSETLKQLGSELDVSPLRAQSLLRGYFSTIGEAILTSSDFVINTFADLPAKPAWEPSDYPVIGRFVRGDVSRNTKYGTIYYDTMKEMEEVWNTVRHYRKTGDLESAKELAEKGRVSLMLRPKVKGLQKQVRALTKRAKMIWDNENMTPEEKREALRDITQRQNDVYEKFYDEHQKVKAKLKAKEKKGA